jgi:two-component system, cell cycle response regulator DivK
MSTVAPLLTTSHQEPPLTLLVDRDSDTRQMYAEYLQLSHCRIEQADDGREALAKAISRHPDIIVTETRLPGINGFDLCSLLRNDGLTRDIPIVVVTGDGFDGDVQRAKHAGADTVLVKPCLPQTLLVEMRRLLDRSAELRERSVRVCEKITEQLVRSDELRERSHHHQRRIMLSRSHNRHETIHPPLEPPPLVCPACDQPLHYQRSVIGGVNARNSEQWDYYECPAECGQFQYRQRTRKLRKVTPPPRWAAC